MTEAASVSTEFDPARRVFHVKIGAPLFEVNVVIPEADVGKLREAGPWEERRSVAVGHVVGATAHWATSSDGTLSLLVGHDSETWDVGFTLPLDTLNQILREVAGHAQSRDA